MSDLQGRIGGVVDGKDVHVTLAGVPGTLAALAAAGYLTPDEERRMHEGLDALRDAWESGDLTASDADEDVHGALEAALIAEVEGELTEAAGLSTDGGPDATATVAAVRAAIADDLDTPQALAAVDAWVEQSLGQGGQIRSAPGELARAIDALLGIRL